MAGVVQRESEIDMEHLKARLAEAEETIRAIQQGEVDAVVVNGPSGPKVYTLEGSDHPYRVLVEQMHEGTVTLDVDGLILYSNRQFATLIASPEDSVSGLMFTGFLSNVDSHLFSGLVEAAAARGHSSGELNLRAAGGAHVPVRISVTSLDVGGLRNLCLVVNDLREQRRNEALIKEEQLSRMILEQAGEAIIVIDPQGIVVRRSESAKSLASLGLLQSHFDHAFRLTASGRLLDAQSILSAMRANEHMRGIEAALLDAGGNVRSLLVSASPLWAGSNELVGCVITLTDITERKRSEEALSRQAGELARSNNDLRQFAYSASHDLREPVRQLAVFSELLRNKYQDNLDDEANHLLEHTVTAAHRMVNLLSDLAVYMQLADGAEEVGAPPDANEVVRRALAILEGPLEESGARIECDPLPKLQIHEVHLTQLFQNLIGNALKYRSEATPLIRISADRVDGMWRLTVADNGIGIEPEYHLQIFGLFRRLHGGGKYVGSGIGLAICQKIVQRYGGRIWVQSELGGGSQFMFTLPGPE